jgi:hypothetical protein
MKRKRIDGGEGGCRVGGMKRERSEGTGKTDSNEKEGDAKGVRSWRNRCD